MNIRAEWKEAVSLEYYWVGVWKIILSLSGIAGWCGRRGVLLDIKCVLKL